MTTPAASHRSPPPGGAVVAALAPIVPADRRQEWAAEWLAELDYRWTVLQQRSAATPTARGALILRSFGALPDALWLRRHNGGHDMLRQDLRYAMRTLARRPGFASIVVLTLALCIGATTAIFTVVNAVLLRPLPYRDPARLVMVWSRDSVGAVERNVVSAANYFDWRARGRAFSELGAYFPTWNATITGDEMPERLEVGVTSANLFALLGARSALGRTFLPEEDRPGGPRAAILAHGLWSRRFGADPRVVGREITLDGQAYTVVGVMPNDFRLPGSAAQLFTPLPILGGMLEGRIPHLLNVVGRLAPGTELEQARAEMTALARQLEAQHPETNTGWGVTLVPLHEQVAGDMRRPLLVLLAAVAAVLLIGCANIANLLLTRAAGRQREMAVRAALGAPRRRLVVQMLTESAAVAAVSGVFGVALAYLGVRVLSAMAPASLPRLNEIGIDARVLAFTVGVSLLTALIFGLAPALHTSRLAMVEKLSDGARGATGGASRRRLRNVLAASEIVFAVVLLVAAGLLVVSFHQLRRLDPGFRAERVVAMKVSLPRSEYGDPAGRAAFFRELIGRVRSLPTVMASGAITRLPLRDQDVTTRIVLEGREAVPMAELPEAGMRHVSADYFLAMGIPVLSGRALTDRDVADSTAAPVVLVNRALARRLFPGADPVGRRLAMGGGPPGAPVRWRTIVGVVGDVHDGDLRAEPKPQIYLSYLQTGPTTLSLVVRSSADPAPLIAAARREVAALDAKLPLFDVTTLPQVLSDAVTRERFLMMLLGTFAGVAIVLASVGVYGVMAYGVTERTREIGIRLAFGARNQDVMRLVLGEGLVLAVTAVLLGLAAAWASTRAMSSLLYGITAADPRPYAAVALLLLAVAMLASYLPARRAARMDPVAAMRSE